MCPSKKRNIFLNFVKSRHPSLPDLAFKVFDDGWDHVIILVEGSLAYRFPRSKSYSENLIFEKAFLDNFSKISPLNIPKLILGKNPKFNFATYNFIPGEPFTSEEFKKLTFLEQEEAARRLGNFLTSLHSFPLEEAKNLGLKVWDTKVFWKRHLAFYKRKIFPLLTKKESQWIDSLFNSFLKVIKSSPVPFRVAHCDMRPEHIIFNSTTKTITGIIDFGDLEITDPAYDLQFENCYGKIFLEKIYQNYKILEDETFDKRRTFYEMHNPLNSFRHALKYNLKEKIDFYKSKLTQFILTHPLS